MDYAKPTDVVATMIDVSQKKLMLTPRDLLIRGALSGALLATSISLALGGAIAVLYAPEKGQKTRKKLSKRSVKWQETANDAVGVAGEFVSKGRKRVGI